MVKRGVVMAIWKLVEPKQCIYNNQQATIIAEYLHPRHFHEEPRPNTVAIKLEDGTVLYYIPKENLK